MTSFLLNKPTIFNSPFEIYYFLHLLHPELIRILYVEVLILYPPHFISLLLFLLPLIFSFLVPRHGMTGRVHLKVKFGPRLLVL